MGPFLIHTGGQNLDRQLWSKSREEQAEHVVTNSSAEQPGARQLRPVRVQSCKPVKACQRSWDHTHNPLRMLVGEKKWTPEVWEREPGLDPRAQTWKQDKDTDTRSREVDW